MEQLIGQTIEKYHILEQVGEGGMAVVYRAQDMRLEREVAIKIIRRELVHSGHMDETMQRFEREAKSLAKMSHPHIVKIHDYGNYQGAPFLAMEFLGGGNLKDRLGKPIHYIEAASLLAPVARALDYAHNLNVVHRDVKPANIMFTQQGQPILTDFGIAKILGGGESTGLTQTGVGLGTPDYMSPEQGMGEPVDHRSDIYALGVVFYEMVTGIKPFQADTPLAVLVKHIKEPVPRPRLLVPNISDDVERAIYRSMAKKPANRFASMKDFAILLERIAGMGEELPKSESENATVVGAINIPAPQEGKTVLASASSAPPSLDDAGTIVNAAGDINRPYPVISPAYNFQPVDTSNSSPSNPAVGSNKAYQPPPQSNNAYPPNPAFGSNVPFPNDPAFGSGFPPFNQPVVPQKKQGINLPPLVWVGIGLISLMLLGIVALGLALVSSLQGGNSDAVMNAEISTAVAETEAAAEGGNKSGAQHLFDITPRPNQTISNDEVCSGAVPSRLQNLSYAMVSLDPPLASRQRSGAGRAYDVIVSLEPGTMLHIIGGPQCADSYIWWKVQPVSGGSTGWVAEGELSSYWLIPCQSASRCE